MRVWPVIFIIAVAAILIAGTDPRKGSLHMAEGTDDYTKSFTGSVANLTVAPATADVVVLHDPHYARQDSFTVKAGDVMNWDGLDIYGFTIDRTSATVVDVYWW